MLVRELRERPPAWKAYKTGRPRWLLPLHAVEWTCDWAAYYLAHWAFLEVLEYLGIFSVLIAIIFYFSEAGDRKKQKHYQAWQVINTAQGKGGSGGRIEALQELNMDHIPLVGVDASGSFLQGVQLPKANLLRCDLHAADLREGQFPVEQSGIRQPAVGEPSPHQSARFKPDGLVSVGRTVLPSAR